jgi:D-tyrosyl-tRNA(Tyr) deacylase
VVSRVAWARVVVRGSGGLEQRSGSPPEDQGRSGGLEQRSGSAPVDTEEVTGEIGPGLLVLVGVGRDDGPAEAAWLAEKVAGLRVFDDEAGVPNRCLSEAGGGALVVSQFTLYGDARRGRRPSYVAAARPEEAAPLVEAVASALAATGLTVAQGRFRAHMRVESAGDGPFTILLDSEKGF